MMIWLILIATFIALVAGGASALLVHYVIWKDDEREIQSYTINVNDAYRRDN